MYVFPVKLFLGTVGDQQIMFFLTANGYLGYSTGDFWLLV